MNHVIILILLCVSYVSYPRIALAGQDNGGMNISAAADLIGGFNLKKSELHNEADDSFQPRAIDINIYGAIDPYFDGVISVSAHKEEEETIFTIHEAYISSSRLLPRSQFRLGKFFLDIGRLNNFHQHEWPFITAPLVHKEFFGSEGVIDSGLEYSYLAPLPFYLDIRLGISNGYTFGHSHGEGEKPKEPNQYMHVLSFLSLGQFDLQPGFSLLRRRDHDNRKEQYTGVELTAKKKTGRILTILSQTEAWHRVLKPQDGQEETTLGAYSYFQYGFENGIELGLRLDYLTVDSLKDALGNKAANWKTSISPSIGIKPSEFSRLRLAYNHYENKDPSLGLTKSSAFFIQTTFTLGAHPAHAF